uniref:Secreted protein n=1 Tax=Rhipicephalus appendiculatus TaxID=34631 RepID=A0A131YCG4_RHIAP
MCNMVSSFCFGLHVVFNLAQDPNDRPVGAVKGNILQPHAFFKMVSSMQIQCTRYNVVISLFFHIFVKKCTYCLLVYMHSGLFENIFVCVVFLCG